MKLLSQSTDYWQFELGPREVVCLRALMGEFPLVPAEAARITAADADPKTVERERLLQESLAEHRATLKTQAATLLAEDRLSFVAEGWRLRLDPETREALLQILNDIRVGSWHALGEPENPASISESASAMELRFYGLMQFAGYFECCLLE